MDLNNVWVLTGLLVAIVTAFAFGLTYLIPVDITFSSIIILVASIYILGYYYTSENKKVMPEDLRKGVAIRFTIIQFIIGTTIVYFLTLVFEKMGFDELGSFLTVIMIGLLIFVAFLDYFIVLILLGSGGKAFLKKQATTKK
jgi:hypothetical protein